jgi:DNA-binding transcriptional regulator YdaS (Cro superfamily)
MTDLRSHIQRAVTLRGSQAKLASAMGCSQQQIAYLLKASSITAEMAMKVDEATDGVVSRRHLRPDIFGPEPKVEAAE